MKKQHPIQPTEMIDGIRRFKKNEIVRKLLDHGPFDMNQIALWDVSDDDRDQFHQLIGYSLSRAPVSDEIYEIAERMAEGESEDEARINRFEALVSMLKAKLREPMAELFGKHPDDFSII